MLFSMAKFANISSSIGVAECTFPMEFSCKELTYVVIPVGPFVASLTVFLACLVVALVPTEGFFVDIPLQNTMTGREPVRAVT